MDNRADMHQREAYLRHRIAQMSDEGIFSTRNSYEMAMSTGRLDLLNEQGEFRTPEELYKMSRTGKLFPLSPLPEDAKAFAVELPPVDVEAVKKKIDDMPPDQLRLIYKALADRGDFLFVDEKGEFQNFVKIANYYDIHALMDEARPKPVPASKDVLKAKAAECSHEVERIFYLEMARKGQSFIDKEGKLIAIHELDLNFMDLDRMAQDHEVHRYSDQISSGKDLFTMLSDSKKASGMKIEQIIAELPQPVLQEFFDEVAASNPKSRSLYRILQEMVDATSKPAPLKESEIKDELRAHGGDDLDSGFWGGFPGYSSGFGRSVEDIQLERGLSYIGNIIGKAHDPRSGRTVEVPVVQGVRYALEHLSEHFTINRPVDPDLAPPKAKTLGEKLAVELPPEKQSKSDRIKARMFGKDWRSKFTKSQGGDLPDPPTGGDKGRG